MFNRWGFPVKRQTDREGPRDPFDKEMSVLWRAIWFTLGLATGLAIAALLQAL